MTNNPTLFWCQLGGKQKGRIVEQHDMFFSIGNSISDLIPDIKSFWPDMAEMKKFHIDSYRQVTYHTGHTISVEPRTKHTVKQADELKLFFINLGGYKEGVFGEFHYADIYVATNKGEAVAAAKKTIFFKHTGYEGANSHIDDKYGIDVDDEYEIEELLPEHIREKYCIRVLPTNEELKLDVIISGFNILSGFKK